MRRWETQAAPDDPEVWTDVSGLWPTVRGTYETADQYATPLALTATGESTVRYSFCASTTTGVRNYVCGAKTWEYSGGVLTDRTGGVGVPQQMAQFGNITIGVCGNATATVSSSGGNFANLAGAPKGNIVVTQSGAVLIFNTDTASDGWAASDIGDYTNWTTGEAASGRLLQTPGPIIGAIAFQNYVLVFKPSSIFRGQYVGGLFKWIWDVVWRSHGMRYLTANPSQHINAMTVCDGLVVFLGTPTAQGEGVYAFDGTNVRLLNPNTAISSFGTTSVQFQFDPSERRLFIGAPSGIVHTYCLETGRWGKGTGGNSYPNVFVTGDPMAIQQAFGLRTNPPGWTASANTLSLYIPVSASFYADNGLFVTATSSKFGRADTKTKWQRLIPLLRKRTETTFGGSFGSGATLTVNLYRDLRGDASATSTQSSIAEASYGEWFDFLGTDSFADFMVTFNNLDVEIDDYLPVSVAAGKN